MPNQNTTVADAARQIAALRRQTQSACVVCGSPIEGITTRRYCSDRCRSKAYYRRKHPGAVRGEGGVA